MPAPRPLLQLTGPTCSFRHVPDDLHALQLQAIRERFGERRSQIQILDKRATDAGATDAGVTELRRNGHYRCF